MLPVLDGCDRGRRDTNTAQTIVGNLAAITTHLAEHANSALYWDGGHVVHQDAPELITWVAVFTLHSLACSGPLTLRFKVS